MRQTGLAIASIRRLRMRIIALDGSKKIFEVKKIAIAMLRRIEQEMMIEGLLFSLFAQNWMRNKQIIR